MWSNMDDVLRDISKLKEFGFPGHVEPNRPNRHLCLEQSNEKLKTPSNETPDFIDPRTGELVRVPLESNEIDNERLGFYSSSMTALRYEQELQNQLKMVRKIRPNDEIIEQYFGTKGYSKVNEENNNETPEKACSGTSFQSENSNPSEVKSTGSQEKWCSKAEKKSSRGDKNVLLMTLLEKSLKMQKKAKYKNAKKNIKL